MPLVLRPDLVRQRARQADARIRKLVRHAVLAHRDLDLHAGVVDLAQHFLHAADRLAVEARRLGEFDHDHLPRLGEAGRALGDQDVLAVALVFGRDEPHAALVQQAADDRLRGPFDDLDDAPFGAALAVVPHDARLDAVLVQHGAHFVGRQVDVALAVVANHVSMAIAMALDHSLYFIEQPGADVSDIFDIESFSFLKAQVAELVDALVSGTSE